MYLLNPLAFARDLRADRVTEGVKARYLVLGGFVQYVHQAWRSSSGAEPMSPLSLAASAAAMGVAVYVCYRANAAGDGRRFIERFVCLAVPLSVWTFLVGIAVAATLYHAIGFRGETYKAVGGGMTLLIWILYFAALRWLIVQASKNTGPPPLPRSA